MADIPIIGNPNTIFRVLCGNLEHLVLLAKQNSHKYCPFIIAKSLFLLLSAPSDSPSFPIGRNAHCRHSVRKCQEVGGSISSLHPSLHSFSQDITFIIRVLAINSSSFLVFYLLFLHIARFTRELMQCCTKALFPMAEKIRQHHALGYPKPNAGGFIISLHKLTGSKPRLRLRYTRPVSWYWHTYRPGEPGLL